MLIRFANGAKALLASIVALVLLACGAAYAQSASAKKPNILVLRGHDIGTWNISYNSRGMMGYTTPTSTASRAKAWLSPTIARSRAAQQGARL